MSITIAPGVHMDIEGGTGSRALLIYEGEAGKPPVHRDLANGAGQDQWRLAPGSEDNWAVDWVALPADATTAQQLRAAASLIAARRATPPRVTTPTYEAVDGPHLESVEHLAFWALGTGGTEGARAMSRVREIVDEEPSTPTTRELLDAYDAPKVRS